MMLKSGFGVLRLPISKSKIFESETIFISIGSLSVNFYRKSDVKTEAKSSMTGLYKLTIDR